MNLEKYFLRVSVLPPTLLHCRPSHFLSVLPIPCPGPCSRWSRALGLVQVPPTHVSLWALSVHKNTLQCPPAVKLRWQVWWICLLSGNSMTSDVLWHFTCYENPDEGEKSLPHCWAACTRIDYNLIHWCYRHSPGSQPPSPVLTLVVGLELPSGK